MFLNVDPTKGNNVYLVYCIRIMPRLRQRQRAEATTMLLNGSSQSAVAAHFGVHRSTISRLYQRLRTIGTTNDRPRSGRPRETSRRQDRYIRLVHLRNRFRLPRETAENIRGIHNNRISTRTVRNRLRDFGIRARRPYVGLVLNQQRRQRRMAWLNAHSPGNYTLQQWRRVFFTDESRHLLYRSDRRQRVYRRRRERFAGSCVVERDRYGGGGVMVWAGICQGHKTPLIFIDGNLTAVRYRDNVLAPVVVPFVRRHNVVFQQDNARPHVARVCNDFLTANNVDVLPWPAYSPDLSPIEHLWDILDRKVRARDPPPHTLQGLRQALEQEWNNIPIATVNRLINSMHRRVRAAIAARGGHTRY